MTAEKTGRTPGARQRVPRLLAPYVRLFATPGTRAFTVGNLLARLPIGIFTVSAVVMIATTRGSYALAGAVSATGLVAVAVVGPLTARLIDRYGQARIALPAALVAVAGALSLAACVRLGAPDWTLFASHAVMAATPNTGGMSRARWAHLFRTDSAEDTAARHTANSFEQAADELCFMSGPPLAALLCTRLFPESGTLTGAVLLLTGMLIFTGQRGTEPPVARRTADRTAPSLKLRALLPLLVSFLCVGCVFGSLEVATIAFADVRGQQAAAGLVLACQATGSAMAGLYLGTVRPPSGPVARRFARCAGAMALLALLPLGAAATGSLAVLAVALLIAGMGTAPTMVTGMTLIQRTVPAARLNEGMTWQVTALLGGVASGSAVGGWAADHLPAVTGFTVPPAAAGLAAATAFAVVVRSVWSGQRTKERTEERAEEPAKGRRAVVPSGE
ncbi:Na+/melibiose symporter-like transporter [Streptomyces sp. Amel2xB2]|uniref:MFS transporter n=1 Tax=Streptomyces sp. Amel2xB2 TaxID=1305829 RepID=UPI000DB989B6|nr:MFS transporter [Streptomyces sp. Amel2xB2]RAJ69661.1 Na+/melibiose symporter-like transporter [Streptomyces sp. Amel2xB2]